jgi:hypothetical protein
MNGARTTSGGVLRSANRNARRSAAGSRLMEASAHPIRAGFVLAPLLAQFSGAAVGLAPAPIDVVGQSLAGDLVGADVFVLKRHQMLERVLPARRGIEPAHLVIAQHRARQSLEGGSAAGRRHEQSGCISARSTR